MKKLIRLLPFLCFVLTFLMSNAQAQTRYVTDSFEVMMRTGPSVKKKIIKVLKSGVALDVIEADSGNDYSKVKVSKGTTTGYVLTRYLDRNESAKNRVVYLEGVLEQLQSKPDELQSLLVSSQEQNQSLLFENTELSSSLKQTANELSEIKKISREAINLSGRNKHLESEAQELLLQIDDVRIQNQALQDNADYVKNLTMAGILLLGLFLGWILSRQGKQRRNSWGS